MQRARRAPLLLVDELGGEPPDGNETMKGLLHERYDDNLPTWVTTGVGPKEIAARYGGGIARRVFGTKDDPKPVLGFRLGEVAS